MINKEIEVKIKCDTSQLVRNLKRVNKELDKIRGNDDGIGIKFYFGVIIGLTIGLVVLMISIG